MVAAVAGAAHGSGGKQLLDALEGVGIHQRLVLAQVGHALPLDQAGVDGIGEQVGAGGRRQ